MVDGTGATVGIAVGIGVDVAMNVGSDVGGASVEIAGTGEGVAAGTLVLIETVGVGDAVAGIVDSKNGAAVGVATTVETASGSEEHAENDIPITPRVMRKVTRADR